MQRIAGCELSIGIEIEPALAAFSLGARVPGEPKGLQASARKLDEILLQRKDAEGVFDLEIRWLAVGTGRADEIAAALRREDAFRAVLLESCAVEAPQHRSGVGLLHGESVMRAAPALRFVRVAFGADPRPDETRSVLASGRILGAAGQGEKAKKQRYEEESRKR